MIDGNPARLARIKSLAIILLGALAAGWSASGYARKISVDFTGGTDPNPIAANGDDWVTTNDSTVCATVNDDPVDDPADNPTSGSVAPASCGVVFTASGNQSSQRIRLGFDIRIGDQLYDSVFVNKRGILTFGTARPEVAFGSPFTDLDALRAFVTENGSVTRPFIAPFALDFVFPDNGVEGNFAPFNGGSAYFRATADPIVPASESEAVPALAVLWIQADEIQDDFDTTAYTQLVIYSTSSDGDWQLRLRYGNDDTTLYNEPGDVVPGFAGFSLETGQPADSVAVPNPLSSAEDVDYFFTFEDGHLVTGTPIDTDGDGVPDSSDNCPGVSNTDQTDTDGDAVGDACDADDDGDGVADASDNCPLTANANQANNDGDAQGDVCDPDDDNDGVADGADNCPRAANANQADSDGDGIGDACDAPQPPQRCDADTDGDIDYLDLDRILRAIGRNASGPNDPRDFNGDGKIRLNDLLNCTKRCTRRLCAAN